MPAWWGECHLLGHRLLLVSSPDGGAEGAVGASFMSFQRPQPTSTRSLGTRVATYEFEGDINIQATVSFIPSVWETSEGAGTRGPKF